MTNKEVIINGIDVSECEHRYAKECMTVWASGGSHTLHKVLCRNSPNCYFKQSKRKEKECEELKEDRERWKSNFNGKVSAIEELLQQLDQLKKTLTDIKEIAEKDFNHTCWETYARQLKQILQKISECKGEYNEKIR